MSLRMHRLVLLPLCFYEHFRPGGGTSGQNSALGFFIVKHIITGTGYRRTGFDHHVGITRPHGLICSEHLGGNQKLKCEMKARRCGNIRKIMMYLSTLGCATGTHRQRAPFCVLVSSKLFC